MLLALPAMAQSTLVVGKISTYSPNIAPNALGNYVEFQLTNCGNNTPMVSGSAVLLSKPIDFYPDSTGALTAPANGGLTPSLYGNDVINCGGAFTSRYSVRYFVGGVAQGPAKFYYVLSTAQFNLTTAIPIGLQPPLNPPYPNLTTCPVGSYSNGLNTDLSVKCLNLPNGASNAVVTNPTATQEIANQPLVLDGILSGPTASFGSTNGVLNAAQFIGSDIGVKVNAAFATIPNGGTVHIPAGNYTFATMMVLPDSVGGITGFHIDCDAGAVLTYSGTGNAIQLTNDIPGAAEVGIDGHGGCLLQSASTGVGNGINIPPSNATFVTGMKIKKFAKGIYIPGGNSVQIFNNTIQSNTCGICTTTVNPTGTNGFAPNALHIHDNEISSNGWGYQSADGHVSASHGLGNVIRDNVFEANTSGDIDASWDAHLLVQGNYFESAGVGVSAGANANVYDIHIEKNYFTASAAERSEIEIGYGWDFFIEGNYEEGAHGVSTGCKVNSVPGGGGGNTNIVAVNAFAQNAEGYPGGTTPTPNELCSHGTVVSTFSGTDRISANQTIAGNATVDGALGVSGTIFGTTSQTASAFPTTATIMAIFGSLTIWAGPAEPGGTCNGGAAVFYYPTGWSMCKSGFWVAM